MKDFGFRIIRKGTIVCMLDCLNVQSAENGSEVVQITVRSVAQRIVEEGRLAFVYSPYRHDKKEEEEMIIAYVVDVTSKDGKSLGLLGNADVAYLYETEKSAIDAIKKLDKTKYVGKLRVITMFAAECE